MQKAGMNRGGQEDNQDTLEMVEVKLEDGTTFYVQAHVPDEAGLQRVGLGEKLQSFEPVMHTIEALGLRLSQVWKTVKPARASVELNVDFTCKPGKPLAVMFVDGSVGAGMKITLEWGDVPERDRDDND